jgi:hypothetical protein
MHCNVAFVAYHYLPEKLINCDVLNLTSNGGGECVVSMPSSDEALAR